MKIDKTTYKDREKRQIGMTADHTSRPDKVLFFADRTFFKTIADPHCTHCQSPASQRCNQSFVKELAKPTHREKLF